MTHVLTFELLKKKIENNNNNFVLDQPRRFQHQKKPKIFFGAVPVALYFAAVSSALRRSSHFLASVNALFPSASLWIAAILFFNFSSYSAFFFSSCSYSNTVKSHQNYFQMTNKVLACNRNAFSTQENKKKKGTQTKLLSSIHRTHYSY